MKIEVYIKDSVYTINCGSGSQKLRWLAEVAALKYDPNAMLKVGEPRCLKLQDGTLLNLNDRITDRLYDNVRVWVLFQDFTPADKKKQAKGDDKKKQPKDSQKKQTPLPTADKKKQIQSPTKIQKKLSKK